MTCWNTVKPNAEEMNCIYCIRFYNSFLLMRQEYEANRPHYYKSIDAWVLIPEAKYDDRPVQEILEEARENIDGLIGKQIGGVTVELGEPMTLGQYVPVFRESLMPEPVESDDPWDHIFAQSKDSFYLFTQGNACLLDTQIEIPERRKRRWKNRLKKDRNFSATLKDHGIKTAENVPIPSPNKQKITGYWEFYRDVVIQHAIAEDVWLTIDDPEDYENDNKRAIVATATNSCTIPKYAYLNAMGNTNSSLCWRYNSINHSYDGHNMAVPTVIYSDLTPRPWMTDKKNTETNRTQETLTRAIHDAERQTSTWLHEVIEGRMKRKR